MWKNLVWTCSRFPVPRLPTQVESVYCIKRNQCLCKIFSVGETRNKDCGQARKICRRFQNFLLRFYRRKKTRKKKLRGWSNSETILSLRSMKNFKKLGSS